MNLTEYIRARYSPQNLNEIESTDEIKPCTMRRLAAELGIGLIAITAVEYLFSSVVMLLLLCLLKLGLLENDIVYNLVTYFSSSLISYLPKIAVLSVLYHRYRTLYSKYHKYDNSFLKFLPPIILLPCSFALGMWGSNITNLINLFLQAFFGAGEIEDVMESMAPSSFEAGLIILGVTAIVAPLAEEFIYRKLLLTPLRVMGDAPAVIISALVFGLAHGNFDQFAYAFFTGLLYGAVAVRYGSIIPTIILHFLNNFLVTITTYQDMLKSGIWILDGAVDVIAAVGNFITNLSYFGGFFLVMLLVVSKFLELKPVDGENKYEKLRCFLCPILIIALGVMLIMFID